jgi:hypothetical protein
MKKLLAVPLKNKIRTIYEKIGNKNEQDLAFKQT